MSPKNRSEIFSKRLRELRLKRGLTQKEMAEKLNVQRSTYTWYEGGRIPNMEILRETARVFGVSVDYLLGVDADFKLKSLDFEAEWPEGAQVFRRGTKELTDAQKRDVVVMLKAIMNNLKEEKRKGNSDETAQGPGQLRQTDSPHVS